MKFFTKQSRKYISDRFQRFTKQDSSHRQSQSATTDHSTSSEGTGLLSPQRWGLPEDIIFRVSRGGSTSQKPCTFDELMGFIDSCGLDPKRDESRVAAIIAGIPFEIDGHSMRFDPIQVNGASIDWAMNAHPLKQITIDLQGTRHSEVDHMVKQLQEAAERIKRGETQGESSDDDFGYKFSVNSSSNKPSLFDQSLTRNKQTIEEPKMDYQKLSANTVVRLVGNSALPLGETTLGDIKEIRYSKKRMALATLCITMDFISACVVTFMQTVISLPGTLAGLALISYVYMPGDTIQILHQISSEPYQKINAGFGNVLLTAILIYCGWKLVTGQIKLSSGRFSVGSILQRKLQLPEMPVVGIYDDGNGTSLN